MAVGDAAQAAGYGFVPDTGEDGRVRHGAREINRTRDFLAQLKALIPSSSSAFRSSAGITYGSTAPSGGAEGDIYFRIL